MNADIKARSHWLMGYGLSRATLKLLARRGDPFAQLLIDSSQTGNVYHLVEQIRQRGRMSAVVGNGWVTADARDHISFGTGIHVCLGAARPHGTAHRPASTVRTLPPDWPSPANRP